MRTFIEISVSSIANQDGQFLVVEWHENWPVSVCAAAVACDRSTAARIFVEAAEKLRPREGASANLNPSSLGYGGNG